MSVHDAARALTERLRGKPWFTAVGIGEADGSPCLYLYVNSARKADVGFLRDGWNGYRVEVRRMGPPRVTTGPLAG